MAVNKENIEKEYIENRQRFEAIANEINATLKRIALRYYNETRFQVYIPPLRIKAVQSIIGKLVRKNRDATSLIKANGKNMQLVCNDFIGGRILCNTQDDVFAIEKIVSTYPRLTVEKREYLKKENGYSALHLDILYETYWDDQSVLIPLELQVKTHFQHAWAEITHDDDYKPDENSLIDDSIKAYYTHISSILNGLDGFLITIRKQKLSLITPPTFLTPADTVINSNTLSYAINKWSKEKITLQEMNILLKRLKEEGFETIQDVDNLFNDREIEARIKQFKEDLSINENVTAFEMVKYGSLLNKSKDVHFGEEIKSDFGFVKEQCQDCGRNLTKDELKYINLETDSDMVFYCETHRDNHFPNKCRVCNKKTASEYCISCAGEKEAENI